MAMNHFDAMKGNDAFVTPKSMLQFWGEETGLDLVGAYDPCPENRRGEGQRCSRTGGEGRGYQGCFKQLVLRALAHAPRSSSHASPGCRPALPAIAALCFHAPRRASLRARLLPRTAAVRSEACRGLTALSVIEHAPRLAPRPRRPARAARRVPGGAKVFRVACVNIHIEHRCTPRTPSHRRTRTIQPSS